MAHIRILVDRKTDDIILPKTISQAVYHDGETVHSIIQVLKTKAQRNREDINTCLNCLTWS